MTILVIWKKFQQQKYNLNQIHYFQNQTYKQNNRYNQIHTLLYVTAWIRTYDLLNFSHISSPLLIQSILPQLLHIDTVEEPLRISMEGPSEKEIDVKEAVQM